MFDFRYHVASLAAVFLALVIGMLVGAGISGRGLLDESERNELNEEIARRDEALERERARTRELEASGELAEDGYDVLLADRLADKRIAVLFVGAVDSGVRSAVEETVNGAGGRVIRLRAVSVPLPVESVDAALRRPALVEYAGRERLEELGRALAAELVNGGETPLWDALAPSIVEERGPVESSDPAHGIVVCRTAVPQQGETARFLRGLYAGLGGAVDAAVGVETSTSVLSAVDVYRRHGLSSVDAVELPVGRVALAVLLAGEAAGHYGVKDTASATVPPIDPVSSPPVEE